MNGEFYGQNLIKGLLAKSSPKFHSLEGVAKILKEFLTGWFLNGRV
jgi:hypothetical protein